MEFMNLGLGLRHVSIKKTTRRPHSQDLLNIYFDINMNDMYLLKDDVSV